MENGLSSASLSPFPVQYLGHVFAVFADVLLVVEQFFLQFLFQVRGFGVQLRQAIDHILGEMEARSRWSLSTAMSNGVVVVPSSS